MVEENLEERSNYLKLMKNIRRVCLGVVATAGSYLLLRDVGIIPDQAEAFVEWHFDRLDSPCFFYGGLGLGLAIGYKELIDYIKRDS